MNQNILYLIVLFLFYLSLSLDAAGERITLLEGDIFLGQIISEDDYSIKVDRYGIVQNISKRWVKRIETEENDALPVSSADVLSTTSILEIKGRTVHVIAEEQAFASHLQSYSWYSHFWMEADRFMRGYLVNNTHKNYKTLFIRLQYMDQLRKVYFRQETEIFNAYGMTMKPFIVDIRDVPWEKIDMIRIDVYSAVEIRR